MGFFKRLFGQKDVEEVPNTSPKAADAAPPPGHVIEIDTDPTPPPAKSMPPLENLQTKPLDAAELEKHTAETAETYGQTRPLPDLEADEDGVIPSAIYGIEYAKATNPGRTRPNNEDAYLTIDTALESTGTRDPFGVYIVADGMGGHEHGEQASILAAKTIAWCVMDALYMPMLSDRDPDQTPAQTLQEAMHQANLAVKRDVPDGGTTATVAVIQGSLLHIGHVGDSRAYLIKDGIMERLTRDHSLVARLVEIGQMTEDEARVRSDRNRLYQGIGLNEQLDVHQISRQLTSGSQIVMCSDGLWDMVPEEDILSIVLGASTLQQACQVLIEKANNNGGNDNITVILLRIK